MERLELLLKIYLHGETLSSEEMNLVVTYINNIIEVLNSLILRNNGISNGHCEMRYILSSTLPQKPATGSNGMSNGWSDLYLLPERGSGNSTWMSLCFVSGEDSYGEWSTPICISSGTVTGPRGLPGESGVRGSFTSRVFKRQNSKPNAPIGGTYDEPIPEGWYDGVPPGIAIIWSSTCTFYGDGTTSGWSEPAQESDTATLDIEFSPSQNEPYPPIGNIPFSNHEVEGWYDPNSPNFNSVGDMIWRAERKVSNGEYDGDWTITRILGEKGEKGSKGDSGGNYEFRYINFKATEQQLSPIKPASGSDGITGGWLREQLDLTEEEIKNGTFTWMTSCFRTGAGVYGTWTDPLRITGANGINGEDGTEHEYIFHRNNTGNVPHTPPTILLDDWYGANPNYPTEIWTDNPLGVDDIYLWEFVSTREKFGNTWSEYSTPVLWAKWGKQGKIGQMSYLAGVWNSNTTYTKTDEKSPVVYYNGNYYYIKGDINSETPSISSTGLNPALRPDVWAMADSFEMVFTDILFVNQFAKLASFIINEDWLISKHGTLYDSDGNPHEIDNTHSWNGINVNEAYIYFDPTYVDSNKPGELNFVPSIAIDSLSGRAFLWKGKFSGDIIANSLTLGSDISIDINEVNGLNGALNDRLPRTVGTPGDTYFNVSSNGLLTAENAVIYGDVFANRFRAGNPQGLNITVTGSSINFNYGNDTGAWFSTIDPNGLQSNTLFLYIKNSSGDVYTLDFSNLLQVNATPGSTAVQLYNIYRNVTDSNPSDIFISVSDGKYYYNSQLTSMMGIGNGIYYEKMVEGNVLVAENGYNIIYPAKFFNKVSFNNGGKIIEDSNYWVSATINGTIRELRGSYSAVTFHDYDTYVETTNNLISDNNLLSLSGNNTIYSAQTGTGGGGYITNCIYVAHQGGATIADDRDYAMHS